MSTYAGNDAFPESMVLPDDTAPPTAAEVNPDIEALADRTRWLKNRTGTHRLVAIGAVRVGDPSDAKATITVNGDSASWSSTAYVGTASSTMLASFTATSGDIIEFVAVGTLEAKGAIGDAFPKVIVYPLGATTADVPGAKGDVRTKYECIEIDRFVNVSVQGAETLVKRWQTASYGDNAQLILADIAGEKNDVLEMTGFLNLNVSCTANRHETNVHLAIYDGATVDEVEGARVRAFCDGAIHTNEFTSATLQGEYVFPSAGHRALFIDGVVDVAADTAFVEWRGPGHITMKLWRPQSGPRPAAIAGEFVADATGTVKLALDGRVSAADMTLRWLGAFTFIYRVWRANPA